MRRIYLLSLWTVCGQCGRGAGWSHTWLAGRRALSHVARIYF